MVAQRKTPTQANGGSDDGVVYSNAVDAEVAALWKTTYNWLTGVAGSANAITATTDTALAVAITAYARPMGFLLEPVAANTAAATINIDGVGVVDLQDKAGDPLQGGELAIGSLYPMVFDGTAMRLPTVTAGSANAVASAPDMIVQDQKTSGTDGGTFTSGAWQLRTLNTVVRNVISGASLASNQVTLPAGTYYIEWAAPGSACNAHKSRLYNATDASVVEYGDSASSTAAELNTNAEGATMLTLTSAKALQIEHRCQTTRATDGFGAACSFSVIECYSKIKIWKQ